MNFFLNANRCFLMILLVALTVNLTACSSSDDDNGNNDGNDGGGVVVKGVAGLLAGTYKGIILQVSGEKEVTLTVTAVSEKTVRFDFVEAGLPVSRTTEVYRVGDDEVWGKTPLLENVLYYVERGHLTYQAGMTNDIFSFQGFKQ